jgi:hypothetical protein
MIRHLSTGTHPRTDTSKSPPTSKCFRFLLQIPNTFHASYLTLTCILCSLIFALLKSFWGNCSTIYKVSFAATAVLTSSSFTFPRKALKKWQLQRSLVSLRVLIERLYPRFIRSLTQQFFSSSQGRLVSLPLLLRRYSPSPYPLPGHVSAFVFANQSFFTLIICLCIANVVNFSWLYPGRLNWFPEVLNLKPPSPKICLFIYSRHTPPHERGTWLFF